MIVLNDSKPKYLHLKELIEPLLMVGIGILVAILGLALYLPLFQAYQQ